MLRVIYIFCIILIVQGEWRNGFCNWRFGSISIKMFDFIQCFYCYLYYPDNLFPHGKPNFTYNLLHKTIIDPHTGYEFSLDPFNKSIPMYKAFSDEKHAQKWADCCHAATRCCIKMQKDPFPSKDENKLCPRTWDGWQCWPDTEPGVTATSVCPDYIYFTNKVSCSKPAEKKCLGTGEWLKVNGSQWTDFRPCGIRETHFRRIYFHLSCLGISIAFLIPAIFIFIAYKRLHVHRIYIHTNLFISLLFSCISAIIMKSLVILNQLKYSSENTPEESILSRNEAWCKFLAMSTKYFRLTNYLWMFCEGLYLHKLITAAFTEQKNLYGFYFLGWGFPLIPVVIYSVIRITMADNDCWTVPTGVYEWITHVPMLLALGLNLIFLCNINRVLITKLRTKNNSQEPTHYRKAVRATLVLIPLFGLHSIMAIYRTPADACKVTEVYSYVNDGLDGLQGMIVAVIFCYTNNEVRSLLKQTYNRCKLQKSLQNAERSNNGRISLSLSVITRSSLVLDDTT